MFRRVVVFFLLSLLFLNVASALSTTMKTSYLRGETIIAKVEGSLLNTISNSQIEFKRANVRIPVDFDVKKLEQNYYFWATSPDTQGNYTLYIYNVATQDNQQLHTYTQNFSVGSNKADYRMNPAVITTNGNFNVNVLLNLDTNTEIETDFPSQTTLYLYSGNNQITYIPTNKAAGLYLVNLGVYKFPVYLSIGTNSTPITNSSTNNITNNTNSSVLTNVSSNNSTTNSSVNNITNNTNSSVLTNVSSNNSTTNMGKQNKTIIVEPTTLNRVAYFGSSPIYVFTIKNSGDSTINNLTLKYNSDTLLIDFEQGVSVDANKSYQFNVSFVNPLNNTVKTSLQINYENSTISIPLAIDLTKNLTTVINAYSQITDKNSSQRKSNYYCSELSGKICIDKFICSGTNITSLDGQCCVGSCSAKQSSSGYAWIGYLIAGIVVLGIIFMWVKYKKVKPETNPLLLDNTLKPDFKPKFRPKLDSDSGFKGP